MNVYFSDTDPNVAAVNLDDKYLKKALSETARLLSNTFWRRGVTPPYPPKAVNHPCSRALGDANNLAWLSRHFFALCREYTYRFGKTHKCELEFARLPIHGTANYGAELTPLFPNHTAYKDVPIVTAYRKLLLDAWNREIKDPTWTKRQPPEWCGE